MILHDDGDEVSDRGSDGEQEKLAPTAKSEEIIIQLVQGDVFVVQQALNIQL